MADHKTKNILLKLILKIQQKKTVYTTINKKIFIQGIRIFANVLITLLIDLIYIYLCISPKTILTVSGAIVCIRIVFFS